MRARCDEVGFIEEFEYSKFMFAQPQNQCVILNGSEVLRTKRSVESKTNRIYQMRLGSTKEFYVTFLVKEILIFK